MIRPALVFAFLLALYVLVGTLDCRWNEACARAARPVVILLETSGEPATLGECERARPELGRPQGCVSFQNGYGTSWHHRSCWWA